MSGISLQDHLVHQVGSALVPQHLGQCVLCWKMKHSAHHVELKNSQDSVVVECHIVVEDLEHEGNNFSGGAPRPHQLGARILCK